MKLNFSEITNDGLTDIQVLKTTTIHDSRYGAVKITKAMLDQMIVNFNEKVRGIEIMLDAGHNSDKESYGWFKELYIKLAEDGKNHELWAKVELTPVGRKALSEKLYGYISADFNTSYEDNETLKNHGTVLLGAALTNRPVVKGMKSAVKLSEKNQMDMPELLQACGVETVENLVSAFNEFKTKAGSAEQLTEVQAQLSEVNVKLTEANTKLAEAEKEKETAKKTNEFNVLMSEGKAVEAQRESFMKGDMITFAKNAAAVKLGEQSKGGGADDVNEDVELKIMKLSETLMKDNKGLSMTSAIARVLSENPELDKERNAKFN